MPTTSEYLAEVPLFSLLDDGERAALAERVDEASFDTGAVVFQYGDPGGTLYVVRSGVVELFFKNDAGERVVFESVRAGDFFGEISLLDGGPRTTSALVQEKLEALVIDRGDLDEFLRLCPAAAMDLLAATGRRLRETTNLLRRAATRNANIEDQKRTAVMRATDWISDFSGSIPFLLIHCVLFFLWIVLNVRPLGSTPIGGWDPYPFGLLTMSVSLEAIILSVFVLLSQNRQVSRDRVRNEVEYDVNLKAELEIAQLHEKVDDMNASLLARMSEIERATGARRPGSHEGARPTTAG